MLNLPDRSPDATDAPLVCRIREALDRLEALQSLELQQVRLRLEACRRLSDDHCEKPLTAGGPDFVIPVRRAA